MLHFDFAVSQARVRRIPWNARYWLSSWLMSACLAVMPRGRYRNELKLALHDLKIRAFRECFAYAKLIAEDPVKARLTNAEHIMIEALRRQAPNTQTPEILRTAAHMVAQYGLVTGLLFDLLVRAREGDTAALEEAIDKVYFVRRPETVDTGENRDP